MKMKLTNKIIPAGLIGQERYCILSGKPTNDPKVSVYLLNTLDSKPNYSLWNVETLENGKIKMRPYKGADCKELEIQLGETFIEEAFS